MLEAGCPPDDWEVTATQIRGEVRYWVPGAGYVATLLSGHSKALGTGLNFGVYWRDMGVVNLPSGKPTMALTNGAARALARLVPAGHQPHIHVSITDDGGLAQAFVIIEALPIDPGVAVP